MATVESLQDVLILLLVGIVAAWIYQVLDKTILQRI